MNNKILAFPRNAFTELPLAGVWPYARMPQCGNWLERDAIESDENWLQLIPYILLSDREGTLWCYRRAGGDNRLADRRSCGIGGQKILADERFELWSRLAVQAMLDYRRSGRGI